MILRNTSINLRKQHKDIRKPIINKEIKVGSPNDFSISTSDKGELNYIFSLSQDKRHIEISLKRNDFESHVSFSFDEVDMFDFMNNKLKDTLSYLIKLSELEGVTYNLDAVYGKFCMFLV
jgi:hypothetical protein